MRIKLCLNRSHKTRSDNRIGPRLGWSRTRVKWVDPWVSVSTQALLFLKNKLFQFFHQLGQGKALVNRSSGWAAAPNRSCN
jgi:hypothetical protein